MGLVLLRCIERPVSRKILFDRKPSQRVPPQLTIRCSSITPKSSTQAPVMLLQGAGRAQHDWRTVRCAAMHRDEMGGVISR